MQFYVGSYTEKDSVLSSAQGSGIVVCEFDEATGSIQESCQPTPVDNPSWIKIASDRKSLFCVSEWFTKMGYVSSYAIETDGSLTLTSRQSSHGLATCHCEVTQSRLYASSYLDGKLSEFPLKSGIISECLNVIEYEGMGPHVERHEGSHAHQATLSPDKKWLYVCDLGTDRIHVHHLESDLCRKFPAIELAPGVGPRHMVFHPTLAMGYLICELEPFLMELSFETRSGELKTQKLHDLSFLKNEHNIGASAAIHIHPAGNILAFSERNSSSIIIFNIDSQGNLSYHHRLECRGKGPRDFSFSPDGEWLMVALQESHVIEVYSFDASLESPSQLKTSFPIPSPVCIAFS
jgi:6-phosphogluconolactonase